MRNMVGLRPFNQDLQNPTEALNTRVQVRDNSPTARLQAVATPVDTYVRPGGVTGDNSLLQLSRSLSALNPALDKYGDVLMQEHIENSTMEARNKIGGMTFEESQKAMKEGMPEFENPWYKAAFSKSYGQSLASKARLQLRDNYENGFDKENGDVSDLISQQAKADLETVKDNKFAQAGYLGMLRSYKEELLAHDASVKNGIVTERKFQTVADGFVNMVEGAKAKGASPEAIAQQTFAQMESNKELLGVSYGEQQKVLLTMLGQMANDGDERTLNAILEYSRPGIGKLGDVVSLQSQILGLKNTAKLKAAEKGHEAALPVLDRFHAMASDGTLDPKDLEAYRKSNPDVIGTNQALSLLDHNRNIQKHQLEKYQREQQQLMLMGEIQRQNQEIATQNLNIAEPHTGPGLAYIKERQVLTKTGEYKTLSVEEQKKAAVSEYFRQSAAIAKERGETPDMRFSREVSWLQHNGVTNSEWTNILVTGSASASAINVADKTLPQAVIDGISFYQQLKANNPSLLQTHIKDEHAINFYEAVDTGMRDAGLTKEQSVANAIELQKDPAKYHTPFYKQKEADVVSQVKGMEWHLLSNWSGFNSIENPQAVSPWIERLAIYYTKLGLSTDKALEKAKERVQANSIQVNGWLVPTGGNPLPANFNKMAEGKLERFYDERAALLESKGLSKRDLTIRPLGNGVGSYMIIRKDDGQLVDNPYMSTFTVDQVAQEELQLQTDKFNKAKKKTASKTADPTASRMEHLGLE